jgi:DNA modification methylase
MTLRGVQREFRTDDGSVVLYQGDCNEIMQSFADEEFDCVCTDPPYGIGADEAQLAAAKQRIAAEGKTKAGRGWKYYGETNWDQERPTKETFDAILRISKTALIWGGNYFADMLPASMGWVGWDKGQRDFSLADFELAWTSEQRAARFVQYARGKAILEGKVHPTQKPIEVMMFSLRYLRLKSNAIVCDPFAGSFTTAIACKRLGLRCVAIDREPKYFDLGVARITEELHRYTAFESVPKITQRSFTEAT